MVNMNRVAQRLLLAVIAVTALFWSQPEAGATSIPGPGGTIVSIDPTRTFLFTNNDPWHGDGSVPYSLAIDLGALGIYPGSTILLEQLGDYYNGYAGYYGNEAELDGFTGMIGVFSSSPILLEPNILNRVPGGIDAGADIVTMNTLFGGMTTDITQDFGIGSTTIQVPHQASYLFVAAHDIYYSDNSDLDHDFAVRVTPLQPVPEPGTALLLASGVPALLGRRLLKTRADKKRDTRLD